MKVVQIIASVLLAGLLCACGGGEGVDSSGRLNAEITSGKVSVIAGAGTPGWMDGTPSKVSAPTAVAVGVDGVVYVADTGNNRIRKIVGGVVSTLAGTGQAIPFTEGAGDLATFSAPKGVAVDASGNVYVADSGNRRIRKITPAGVVSTVAGDGTLSVFNDPRGIAVDNADGSVYVSDYFNHVIYRVTAAGAVSILAGSVGLQGDTNGSGVATFRFPWGLALSASGYLYVADGGGVIPINQLIRKIEVSTGDVSTLAGLSGVEGKQDGTAANATFSRPAGVAVDSGETVYVADTGNSLIRKIDSTGTVTTVVGPSAELSGPHGIALDSVGDMYVADTFNHYIQKIKK